MEDIGELWFYFKGYNSDYHDRRLYTKTLHPVTLFVQYLYETNKINIHTDKKNREYVLLYDLLPYRGYYIPNTWAYEYSSNGFNSFYLFTFENIKMDSVINSKTGNSLEYIFSNFSKIINKRYLSNKHLVWGGRYVLDDMPTDPDFQQLINFLKTEWFSDELTYVSLYLMGSVKFGHFAYADDKCVINLSDHLSVSSMKIDLSPRLPEFVKLFKELDIRSIRFRADTQYAINNYPFTRISDDKYGMYKDPTKIKKAAETRSKTAYFYEFNSGIGENRSNHNICVCQTCGDVFYLNDSKIQAFKKLGFKRTGPDPTTECKFCIAKNKGEEEC